MESKISNNCILHFHIYTFVIIKETLRVFFLRAETKEMLLFV
jgi:hypothetical protein